MRNIDRKNNLKRANLLAEQRYLSAKGFLVENDQEIEEDWKSKAAAAMMGVGALGANAQAATTPTNNNNSQQISQSQTSQASTSGVADPFNTQKSDDKLQYKLFNSFKSGVSTLDVSNNEVQKLISEVNAFASKNPGAIIKVTIVGSESQVPNQGNLPKGALANARAMTIGKTLQSSVQAEFRFDVKTVMGKEAWQNGANKDDPKYTKEQFIQLQVEALQTSCSITKMKKSKGTTNTLSSSVTGVISNTLMPGNIPDRMVLTDASGQIIGDTGFFADGSHGLGDQVKLIPKYVLELTKLRQSNDPAIQNIDKSTIVKVGSYQELLTYFFGQGADVKKFMRYENDFGKPLQELKTIIESGDGVIVLYNIVPNNVKTIEHDLGESTGKINVYSPLTQTDFDITSKQCN